MTRQTDMQRDYSRALRWGVFPADTYNGAFENDGKATIDAHARHAELKQLEADIDAAAHRLAYLVGGLTIQAMLNGSMSPTAAQSCEFDFIDELAKRMHKIPGPATGTELTLSPRHAATLEDMRSVAQRLRPMWHVTKGERPSNPLLDALGLPYRGMRMTGGQCLPAFMKKGKQK